MNIGYARVSTDEQNLDLQLQALTAFGCAVIHEDKASGALGDRKGLAEALRDCGPSDAVANTGALRVRPLQLKAELQVLKFI